MAFKVVGTNPRGAYAFEYERESLDPIGAEIVIVRYETDEQFLSEIADLDAVIMGAGAQITAAMMPGLRRIKAIVFTGVGVDRADIEAATAAGIPVVNVPDVWVNEVADHAMLLLLAMIRKLIHSSQTVARGGWGEVYNGLAPVPRIQGKTLGLIAFGKIARLVARRAQAFGLHVVAYDPYVSAEVIAEHGVESRSLEDLLRESDFVSAHAPHNKSSHHLMSDTQFALMKPSAIFVNTGRGKVVDEAALFRALQQGKIAAAGLDVLEEEPAAKDNPLRTMPNVVITPQVAYYSEEAYLESRRRVSQEVAAILRGRRPRNCVNPAVLERLSLV
jgi:D-3-phosphoglycerate dehydrogenase